MFRGSYEHTIDGKGRLSIPAKFRDVLSQMRREALGETTQEAQEEIDDCVVITNFVQNETKCLDAYPMEAWKRVEQELLKKQRIDPQAIRFRNFYLGRASECQVDKQGRVLIPPVLRHYAGLKRDVVFVSDLDRFQIWDKETWEKYLANTESEISKNPDKLASFGI
jgi:MraZ protein